MKKREFYDRPDSSYFVPDAGASADYCRKHWPEETEHILRIADQVCQNFFLFDLNWDMERTYEPVVFEQEIDWSICPNGDPEFVWQFNRHRFFICLGQAYALTGDEKYVRGFLRLAEDWMDRVPLNEENEAGPWRMLETGLRGETWTKALRYFKDSPLLSEDFLARFEGCLRLHARRLVEKGGDERLQSNWCVLENSGLFEIALGLPENECTQEWISTALDRLNRSLRVQVYEDGSQWEQSPMYHNEVYHCLCCVIYLAERNGILLPDGFRERVHGMARADLIWRKPDGRQFPHGDSDDTDLGDVLAMGAYLFRDSQLKYVSSPYLDYEDAWDFGREAWEAYEAMEAVEPDFTSAQLADSGNYYLRQNWERNANLLHFACGTMSTGHCHGDKLHVSLVLNGEDVLVDAGRATYMDVPLRFELKDNTGHNTTTVDGKSFTTFRDSWYTYKLSLPVNRCFRKGSLAEYVQGGHLGYMEDGVFVNRRCIWIKPDLYIINDEFYARGSHTYRQYFHFAPGAEVQVQESGAVFAGKETKAFFSFPSKGSVLERTMGTCSAHYNQSQENVCLQSVLEKEGFASMITVMNGGPRESAVPAEVELIPVSSHTMGRNLEEWEAQALRIRIGDRSYVVIICHDEVFHGSDALIAADCFASGSVCVFDTTGRRDGEWLYGGEVLYV